MIERMTERMTERRALRLWARLRHPRTTVRWRLTLLYGGLFLISGAVLLTITYTLVKQAPVGGQVEQAVVHLRQGQLPLKPPPAGAKRPAFGPNFQSAVPGTVAKLLGSKAGRSAALFVGTDQRGADLHQLVVESAIALAIMAVLSTALGWVVAGRVLGPLRTMTAATREISAASLDRRLAMAGPRDELRELADTIDGLLGRLQSSFEAERQFVANASHELRTPLTAVRAMLEMVITDPRATVQSFRTICRQALEEGERQEELIDALLALAQGQRGLDRTENVDLTATTEQVTARHRADALARGLELEVTLAPARLVGDRRLIERLITNLLENALVHNVPQGRITVAVGAPGRAPTFGIENTGPAIPPEEIDRLLQPFQRLGRERVGHRAGLGLGLSIVAAIAAAHGADLEVQARVQGGLKIEVRFPAASSPGDEPRPGAQPEPALSLD